LEIEIEMEMEMMEMKTDQRSECPVPYILGKMTVESFWKRSLT
jgi:hypothetical protein